MLRSKEALFGVVLFPFVFYSPTNLAQTLTSFKTDSLRVAVNSPVRAFVEFQSADKNWCGFYINWGDGKDPQSFRIGKKPDLSSPVTRQRSYERPGTYTLTAYGDAVIKGLNSAEKCEGKLQPIVVTVFDPQEEAAKQQAENERKAKEEEAKRAASQLELEKMKLELARLELENKKKELELEKQRLNDPVYQKQQAELEKKRIAEEKAQKAAEEKQRKEQERIAKEEKERRIAREKARQEEIERKRIAKEIEQKRIAEEKLRKEEELKKEKEAKEAAEAKERQRLAEQKKLQEEAKRKQAEADRLAQEVERKKILGDLKTGTPGVVLLNGKKMTFLDLAAEDGIDLRGKKVEIYGYFYFQRETDPSKAWGYRFDIDMFEGTVSSLGYIQSSSPEIPIVISPSHRSDPGGLKEKRKVVFKALTVAEKAKKMIKVVGKMNVFANTHGMYVDTETVDLVD